MHAIQLFHNSQAVEAKAAVGEAIDILKAEGIRAPVSYLHGTGALSWQALRYHTSQSCGGWGADKEKEEQELIGYYFQSMLIRSSASKNWALCVHLKYMDRSSFLTTQQNSLQAVLPVMTDTK